jgi:ABC-type ATPase involved in cell division
LPATAYRALRRCKHRFWALSSGSLKAAGFGASVILVVIGCAIITDPTLLVADKSTGDLDRASARGDLGLLNRLNLKLGKTITMVTHDQRACDKARTIMHLEKGILNEREEVVSAPLR